MIAAIVLAAGESKRMGSPKALLSFEGKTFIRGAVDMLTAVGLSPIVVVLGAHADEVRPQVEGQGVLVTVNEEYNAGQLSSLQKGLELVRQSPVAGVLVHPVDHPAVNPETIRTLMERFAVAGASMVIPNYRGRRGHPVIFSTELFDELMNAPAAAGARFVVWQHAGEVEDVATEDCGVTQNIDTPEEYRSLRSVPANV